MAAPSVSLRSHVELRPWADNDKSVPVVRQLIVVHRGAGRVSQCVTVGRHGDSCQSKRSLYVCRCFTEGEIRESHRNKATQMEGEGKNAECVASICLNDLLMQLANSVVFLRIPEVIRGSQLTLK